MTLRPHPRQAFSLLETLVATAVAAILALIVYTLVRTIREVRETQYSADEGPATLAAAATRLTRDLACTFPSDDDDAKIRLTVTNVAQITASVLHLTVYSPAPGEDDLAWAIPRAVQWIPIAEPNGSITLQRISKPIPGSNDPEPATTNNVLTALTTFDIRFSDSDAQHTTWSPKERTAPPLAAEIQIEVKDLAPLTIQTPIPVGLKVPRTRGRAIPPSGNLLQNSRGRASWDCAGGPDAMTADRPPWGTPSPSACSNGKLARNAARTTFPTGC